MAGLYCILTFLSGYLAYAICLSMCGLSKEDYQLAASFNQLLKVAIKRDRVRASRNFTCVFHL